jgi:hypothetical protein
MFLLNGKPLSLDRAFKTEDGMQYPANWLRLATPEQRAAIGITEAAPEPYYDQRFYWGVDNPKDHAQLVEQWVGQTKQTAASLLAQYDWYIVRQAETGKAVPQEVLDYRGAVRVVSDNREVMIKGTTSTDQLYAVIIGDYNGLFPWPRGPFEEAPSDTPVSGSDTLVIDGVTSGSYVTADSLYGGSGNDTLTL